MRPLIDDTVTGPGRTPVTRNGAFVDVTAQFRALLAVVDPAKLTVDDRIALVKLMGRCLDISNKQRGGGGRRKPA